MQNTKRLGGQTITFPTSPSVLGFATIVGQKEGEGPLGSFFDTIEADQMFGTTTWEKAESAMVSKTIAKCIEKSNISQDQINYILSGDLLNQCAGSNFGLRDTGIPYLGIFGACSTMAEGLSIGSMIVDGGFADKIMAVAGSHFCSAERQFRYPLEYGGQRPPSAQWTVTGCGAVILGHGEGPYITHVTTGRIEDKGIKDANNMGAAMAPAFVSTLKAHFEDTGRTPTDYDLILSGDLGLIGKQIATELMQKDGYDIRPNYNDCGVMIFDCKTQDTHAGGSGCGCSASVLCGNILPRLKSKELARVLFIATGALMSPTTTQQGESIPSIAHAVVFDVDPCSC